MNGASESQHLVKYLMNKKEMNEIYTSIVLRVLAFSMIGIFVPLFLFRELSYSLQFIILYYMVYSLAFLIATPFGAKLGKSIGIKHSILFSMPLYVVYFGLLYLLGNNPGLFFIIPILYGIAEGVFWINFHIDFSMFSERKQRGKQIGKFYGFALTAGLFGPLIGGLVLTYSTFGVLFCIVAILLLGSAVPMLFTKDVKRNYDFSFKFWKSGNKRDFLSFIAVGARIMVEIVFWPIFVFSILGVYAAMGSLFSMLGILNLIITYVMSKVSDKFSKRKLVRWFSVSHSAVWIVKLFVRTKLELIGAAAFSNVSAIGLNVPYNALMYNKCKKSVEYLVFREMGLSLGRILVLSLVLITGSLLSSFVYASIASLGYMLL